MLLGGPVVRSATGLRSRLLKISIEKAHNEVQVNEVAEALACSETHTYNRILEWRAHAPECTYTRLIIHRHSQNTHVPYVSTVQWEDALINALVYLCIHNLPEAMSSPVSPGSHRNQLWAISCDRGGKEGMNKRSDEWVEEGRWRVDLSAYLTFHLCPYFASSDVLHVTCSMCILTFSPRPKGYYVHARKSPPLHFIQSFVSLSLSRHSRDLVTMEDNQHSISISGREAHWCNSAVLSRI